MRNIVEGVGWWVRQDHQHETDALLVKGEGPRDAAEEWMRHRHAQDPTIEDAIVVVRANGHGLLSSTTWRVDVEAVPVFRARPKR